MKYYEGSDIAIKAIDHDGNAWTRGGGCNVECGGKCCNYIRLQVPNEYITNPDIKKWVELHGIKLMEIDGGTFAMLSLTCGALEDGKCSLFGTEDRPELCGHWPATPSALAGVEEFCTYEFASASSAQEI